MPIQRTNQDGLLKHRFHGHAMRVSGAQFCAAMGMSIDLIQVHGRWKSSAVMRYVQSANLAVTPMMAANALRRHQQGGAMGPTDHSTKRARVAANSGSDQLTQL